MPSPAFSTDIFGAAIRVPTSEIFPWGLQSEKRWTASGCGKKKLIPFRPIVRGLGAGFPMPSPLRRPTILLVEDSEDDAFYFRLSLKRAGLDCDLIHLMDGAAAITYLQGCINAKVPDRVLPDLVFLDLKIPTITGFEVLDWIRTQSFNPALDVAVLSGSEHAGDMARATALGATDYIVKPVQRPKLASRFAAWHERQAAAGRTGDNSLCAAPEPSA
jgi:CheY-like chemotaxis protein